MSDIALPHAVDDASAFGRPRALGTIFYGGLVAGTLDIIYACTASWLRAGVSPERVLRYVASGLLGSAAAEGGTATAALGLALHFLIAFIIAAVYYAASLFLPVLIRQAAVCGVLYGVAAYFVMSYVVVPLSAVPRQPPFNWTGLVLGVLVHAFLIGLPIALFARRSAASTFR